MPLSGLDQAGLQDQAMTSGCALLPPGKLNPAMNGHYKNRERWSIPHPGESPRHCQSWVHSTSNSTVTGKRQCPQYPQTIQDTTLSALLLQEGTEQFPEVPKFRNVSSEVRLTEITPNFNFISLSKPFS